METEKTPHDALDDKFRTRRPVVLVFWGGEDELESGHGVSD